MLFCFSVPLESYEGKRKNQLLLCSDNEVLGEISSLTFMATKKLKFRTHAEKQAESHVKLMAHITGRHH